MPEKYACIMHFHACICIIYACQKYMHVRNIYARNIYMSEIFVRNISILDINAYSKYVRNIRM